MGASARPPSPYSRVDDEHHEQRIAPKPYSSVPDRDGPRVFVDGFRVDAPLAHPPARSASPHMHAEVRSQREICLLKTYWSEST